MYSKLYILQLLQLNVRIISCIQRYFLFLFIYFLYYGSICKKQRNKQLSKHFIPLFLEFFLSSFQF
jgi:hypothetical protein